MHKQIKGSAGIRVSRRLAPIDLDGPRKINHLRDLDAPKPSPCASELSKSGLRRSFYLKTHHVQTGVGHYGVFSGRKWSQQIYSRLREHIHAGMG